MRLSKLPLLFSIGFCLLVFCATVIKVQAQHVSLGYNYKIDMGSATEPPVLSGSPDVTFPDDARRNGVEGVVKLSFTLADNGQVKDVNVIQGLPNGVTEAVVAGVNKLRFKPAKRDDQPVSVTMTLDYTVAMAFDEDDPSVKKPVITDKPAPIYPESKRADKVKGKVEVRAIFKTDGTLEITGISSVLPKEFDKAALEAAKNIKFQPATHKKSKKPVTQTMTVEYDFKP